HASHCALECHPKLVRLLRRSLPSVEVLAWLSHPEERLSSGFDYQIAAGDLAAVLRPSRSSFAAGGAYLRADAERVAYWQARLRGTHPGLQVGFCWRSCDLSGERGLACARLEEWEPVLTVPGAQFVCLQYDECDAELRAFSQRFGIEIRRF